jgi:hypothetical protein
LSLKALELQIAIPKTFDAGKMADNRQQNVINQQLHANEALKKDIERKQLAVNESEEMTSVDEEGQQKNGHANNPFQEKHKKNMEEKPAIHPFKGNLIDFSG